MVNSDLSDAEASVGFNNKQALLLKSKSPVPFHILTCTLGKLKWHVVPLLTLVAAAAHGFRVSEGYTQCL